MRVKAREFIPAILTLALIVSIVVVLMSIINQPDNPAHSMPLEPVDNSQNNNESDNKLPDIVPYYTSYPKQPAASDMFIYTQNIKGHGDIHIKNLHPTAHSIYAILETNSKFGDIACDSQSVAVAKISYAGAVEKVFVLPSRQELEYSASQITPDGLAIICKNKENLLFFVADYQLNGVNKVTLPLSDKSRIFINNSGDCVIFAQGAVNSVYMFDDNQNLKSGFLPSGEIIDVYDCYYHLLVFINTSGGYAVVKLAPNLKIIETTYVQNCSIAAVTPYNDQGQAKLIVAEKSGDFMRLWKIDMNFDRQSAIHTQLSGHTENLTLLPHNNGVMAIFTGKHKAMYIFNNELEASLVGQSCLQNISQIHDFILRDNGCFLLAQTSAGLKAINFLFDNAYSEINLSSENAQKALFILNPNGTLSVFFSLIDLNGHHYTEIVCAKA